MSEELRSGGKGVSHSVQSGAQTLTSSTAICHPKDYRRVICFPSVDIKKKFSENRVFTGYEPRNVGRLFAPWLKHED